MRLDSALLGIIAAAGAFSVLAPSAHAATLPAEYKELVYIEGTGTQYINTEYTPQSTDTIEMEMDLEIKVCADDPRIKDDVGKRAIQRGPVVYCLEEADNPDIDSASFGPQTQFKETYSEDLGGIMRIDSDSLHFIPYYSWDNREAGKMKVWISYEEQPADSL